MARDFASFGPSLVSLIRTKLKREEPAAPPTVGSWLRASAIPFMCSREDVIACRLGKTRVRKIKPDLQLVFDMGHGMHWAFQNRVMGKLDILRGAWSCTRCGVQQGHAYNMIPRPQPCVCHGSGGHDPDTADFEYMEIAFRHEKLRLSGHPDAFLCFPEIASLGVGELKSCSERRFDAVRDVPDFGHVLQMHAYFLLTGLSWGMLLYWCKAVFQSPMVEHFVERDEDTIDALKTMIEEREKAFADPKEPLPKAICATVDCQRAKDCELAAACFELQGDES